MLLYMLFSLQRMLSFHFSGLESPPHLESHLNSASSAGAGHCAVLHLLPHGLNLAASPLDCESLGAVHQPLYICSPSAFAQAWPKLMLNKNPLEWRVFGQWHVVWAAGMKSPASFQLHSRQELWATFSRAFLSFKYLCSYATLLGGTGLLPRNQVHGYLPRTLWRAQQFGIVVLGYFYVWRKQFSSD